MILSSLITFLFLILSFSFITQKKSYKFKEIIHHLQKAIYHLNDKSYLGLLVAFALFLILPLFWGLSFYLKSDYNVVVVVFFLFWSYNWIKYIYIKD